MFLFQQKMILILSVLVALPMCAHALVEEDAIPQMLQDCYTQEVLGTGHDLEAQSNCLQKYLTHVLGKNIQESLPQLDQNAFNWINSLGKEIHLRMKRQTRFNKFSRYNYQYNRYNRYRTRPKPLPTLIPRPTDPTRPPVTPPRPTLPQPTQPRPTPPIPTRPRPPRPNPWGIRVRREIRTLSDEEREDFFDAVKALKADTVSRQTVLVECLS